MNLVSGERYFQPRVRFPSEVLLRLAIARVMMGQKLAVIDYGTGNIRSVVKAFENLGSEVILATNPSAAETASALVFPGQGCFPDCMGALKRSGFDVLLKEWIAADRPFFGICLGLQVLFEWSEEGNAPGLSIFPGKVSRFCLPTEFKVPHMGWNSLVFSETTPKWLRTGLADGDQFYFVHSYRVEPENDDIVFSRTDYGGEFVSGITSKNCQATQFHPEKSQAKGLQIYRNFLDNVNHP